MKGEKSYSKYFQKKMYFRTDQNSVRKYLKICGHNYVIIISRFEHFRGTYRSLCGLRVFS